MSKKRYSAEQIIQLLREVENHTSEGKTISQASSSTIMMRMAASFSFSCRRGTGMITSLTG